MKRRQSMTNDAKSAVTPKLRFPEFQDKPAWETKSLALFLEEAGERVSSKTNLPIYSSTRQGLKRQEDYYDGKTLINKNNYGVVPVGCFVYRHMSDDGLFKFNINDTGEEIAVSKEYPVFRTVNLDSRFLLSKLNYGADFENFAMSQKAGGTRTRLYFSKLSSWRTAIPSLAEQQKIAECLSTLDELIVATSQKLDALKAHKKGLMQQLFPREGETVPRLRFPEFHSSPEWAKKPFSELCEIKHGYAFESEFFSNEGDYVLLTPGNFFEEGGYRDRGPKQKYYTGEIPSDYVLREGDMLVAMTEQAAGLLGSPLLVPESGKFLHNQRLGLVIPKPGAPWTNRFFSHVFNSIPVRKAIDASASGAKVRHTSPIKIGEVIVSVPLSLTEQRRIATCLTSLDELIAAQSDRLEVLNAHKKGLMQQLFPSPADAET